MDKVIKHAVRSLVMISLFFIFCADVWAQAPCPDDQDQSNILPWKQNIEDKLNIWVTEVGANPTAEAQQWMSESLAYGLRYQDKLLDITEIENSTIKPFSEYIANVAGNNEFGLDQAQRLTDIFRLNQIADYVLFDLPAKVIETVGNPNLTIYFYMQEQTADASASGLWMSAVRSMNSETLSYIEEAIRELSMESDQALSAMQMGRIFPRFVDVNVCSIPHGAEVYLVPDGRLLGQTTIEGERFEAGRNYRLRFELGGCQELTRDYTVPYQKHDYEIVELLQCAGG